MTNYFKKGHSLGAQTRFTAHNTVNGVLTPTQVIQVRLSQKPVKVLAIETGLTEAAISKIRNRRTWKWLSP